MAVRAHDIAQGCLGQEPLPPDPTNERRYTRLLQGRVSMVELHDAGRVRTTAVGTWRSAELVEQGRISAPSRPSPVDVWAIGRRRPAGRETSLMLGSGSRAVAVRANDIALGDLR